MEIHGNSGSLDPGTYESKLGGHPKQKGKNAHDNGLDTPKSHSMNFFPTQSLQPEGFFGFRTILGVIPIPIGYTIHGTLWDMIISKASIASCRQATLWTLAGHFVHSHFVTGQSPIYWKWMMGAKRNKT